MPADRATLYTIARTVRFFLETTWTSDIRNGHTFGGGLYGRIPAAGQCGESASLLAEILQKSHHPAWASVSGGYILNHGLGEYQSHCWCTNPTLGLVIDLTADQFNDSPIVITELSDLRYRQNKAFRDPNNHRHKQWREFRKQHVIDWGEE